ncbi:hypothetical protein FOA52_014051 [Chlamydomonas sp. UWO 241]|nr:hypothetical protein FOA52_014051 [Chlamydomonas sp. UWO 241]
MAQRLGTVARLWHQVSLGAGSASQGLASASAGHLGGCASVYGAQGGLMLRGLASAAASTSATVAPHAAARGGSRSSLSKGLQGLIHNYKQLSKFKLSSLVVLTAAGGYVAGSGEVIDWAVLGWTALGTFGAAACANTLNQMYEVANDARMTRTAARPLPAGRMTLLHAGVFALCMGTAGVAILYEKANPLTASLGVANIVLYAAVYTPLKQISYLNTWVGALVGAIPPLMGWAASSGTLEPGAAVLAAALFSWQMPHFMALAWMCKDDYVRGGFAMLSRFDPSGMRTAGVALRHTAALAPLGLLAVAANVATWPFAFEAAALAAAMAVPTVRFHAAPGPATARVMFRASLMYLPVLMALMAIHRTPNTRVSWGELSGRLGDAAGPGVSGAARALARGACGAAEALEESVSGVASRLDGGMILSYVKCPSRVYAEDGTSGRGGSEGGDGAAAAAGGGGADGTGAGAAQGQSGGVP